MARATLLVAAALWGVQIVALAAANLLHMYGAAPPEVPPPTLDGQIHEFVKAWTVGPLVAAFIAVAVTIALLAQFALATRSRKQGGLKASPKRSEPISASLAVVLTYVVLAPHSVTSSVSSSLASRLDALWSVVSPDKGKPLEPVKAEAAKLREAGLESPLCVVELDPRPSLVTKFCKFPSEQKPLYGYASWNPRGVADEWRPNLTFHAVPAGYAQLRQELSLRGVSGRTISRCLRERYIEQEIGNSMYLKCKFQPDRPMLTVNMSCGIIYDLTAQPTCVPIRAAYE